jgi:hypothetical protein
MVSVAYPAEASAVSETCGPTPSDAGRPCAVIGGVVVTSNPGEIPNVALSGNKANVVVLGSGLTDLAAAATSVATAFLGLDLPEAEIRELLG